MAKKLFSKRILCLSKSKESVRMVELEIGTNRNTVVNYATLAPVPEDPQELSKELRTLYRDGGFIARTVRSSLLMDTIKYKRVALPIMNNIELRSVVKRHAEKMLELKPEEIRFDYKIVHIFYENGNKRYAVLVAATPAQEIIEFENTLIKAGLYPDSITSVTFALGTEHAPKRKALARLDDELEAQVFLSREVSHVVFMQQGWFLFSREFFITRNDEKSEEETPADVGLQTTELTPQERFRVVTELARSIQYLQQNYREYQLARIVVCGRTFDMEPLKSALSQETSVKILAYRDVALLNTRRLPNPEDFLQQSAEYATALGIGFGTNFKEQLNFKPVPTPIRKLRFIWGGISIVLLMIAALMFKGIYERSGNLQERIDVAKRKQSIVDDRYRYLQGIQTKRARYKEIDGLTTKSEFDQFRFSPYPFKEISQYLAPTTKLKEMYSRLSGDKRSIQINGNIETQSSSEGRKEFELFYKTIKNSPMFTDWELEPLEIRRHERGLNIMFRISAVLSPLPKEVHELE